MSFKLRDISGLKVTVMGLGLHGGGLASAKFFAEHGAAVTVTDLRSEEVLQPSLEKLSGYNIRFVLGRHEKEDFLQADMVIKNPGVPGNSPFLRGCRRVETDISIFLRLSGSPVLAVTGTKGKSTTVSALHEVLKAAVPEAELGGNITVSPLTFLEQTGFGVPVVLELSSWQLADLTGKGLLQPEVSCITNILHDHQNRYTSMEEYVQDKEVIFSSQTVKQASLFFYDDQWGRRFAEKSPARVFFYSASPLPERTDGSWITGEGDGVMRRGDEIIRIVPADVRIPGNHNRLNLLCAGTMAALHGTDPRIIRDSLADFPGIAHRLEYLGRKRGADVYNDSAATIPDAVLSAVTSFRRPMVLITGGTDKNLDFSPYREIAGIPRRIVLLNGSATEKIVQVLRAEGARCGTPFDNLEAACSKAFSIAEPGDIILFSPGCASFELFANEFDRGDQFKEIVSRY